MLVIKLEFEALAPFTPMRENSKKMYMYFIVTVNFSAYSMIDKGYDITEIFLISIGLNFRLVLLIYIYIPFRQFFSFIQHTCGTRKT